MFQFLNYSFLAGEDCLSSAPTDIKEVTKTKLSNAIFNHFNLTRDTNAFGDSAIPEEWTYDTILNANFNSTINAGNLDYILGQISEIKLKRRVKGTFNWTTLKIFPVTDLDSLKFTFNDFLNAYGETYEYALVPVMSGIEGEYQINSILSKFSGVFIGDAEQSFRFLYEVNYGSNARKQQVGTFEPLGRKYPIIVANGVLSYESGSVSATIINDEFENTGIVDREKTVKKKNELKDFLTNKKPKVLKDQNGNIWLVMVTQDVQVSYKYGSTMGIPQVQFNWEEIGDVNSEIDLYNAGIANIVI